MARKYDAAVMHDYFVDRLVHTGSLRDTMGMVREKAGSGGGGLHGFRQDDVRGGNAVNLAHALARLGMRVLLITHSDRVHEPLLRQAFEGLDAEIRVKPYPAGLTIAFEEKVNVMLSDTSGASDFGPSSIAEEDWSALERSRVACSVNWAANRRGTELLVALRRRLGKEKTIFLNPADFRDRIQEYGDLLRKIAREHVVDWISSNEQEGGASASSLGISARGMAPTCKALARGLGVVYDLHSVRSSHTSEGTRVSSAPVHRIKPKRLTGAGDVWDAGAIYGRLKGMDEVPRLEFANRAAKLYLMSEEVQPPTLSQVMKEEGP
ncbi:MAG: carbohydrate kinase family protein [Nitrososphaerota archaeon]|nr:carbohydrate kinase family protein [Nitrososphaerota archaeon]